MVECEHLSVSVQLKTADVYKVEPQLWACSVCRSRKSPWICLACGVVHCGRYVNGHAKKHAEMCPGHSLCMDQGLSVYCYKHDEYVVNDNHIIRELRVHIEHQLRSSYSSSDSDIDGKPPPPKVRKRPPGCPVRTGGLANLGNTCFMNAILQSLNNLEQFCHYFKKLPSIELKTPVDVKLNHKYHTRQNGDSVEISLVEEMRKVSCALWEQDSEAHSPDSLFAVVWRLVPRFRGYQQQDAHEFMRYILDQLHTELVQVLGRQQSRTNTKTTIVSDIFGGVLQSDVTCLTCKSESQKLDPILDISLDIPKKDRGVKTEVDCQLSDCLGSFTGLEHLTESEWYYCVNCKRRQPSTKQLTLHTLPNVLCIHLKRFHFTSFSRTKLNTMVRFPLDGLDMNPHTTDSSPRQRVLYDLAAIVVHHGSGVTCGHYTAYAYSPKSGSWYHFNDSTVTESNSETVLKQRAYILFYVHRDKNSEYCHSSTPTNTASSSSSSSSRV